MTQFALCIERETRYCKFSKLDRVAQEEGKVDLGPSLLRRVRSACLAARARARDVRYGDAFMCAKAARLKGAQYTRCMIPINNRDCFTFPFDIHITD